MNTITKKIKKNIGWKIVIVGLLTSVLAVSYRILLKIPQQVKAADILIGLNEGYGTSSAANDTNNTISAGSITNAIWKSEEFCKVGKCLYFDGSGDYVTFADNANLDMGAGDTVTIEGWFRTPDITTGSRTIISKYETTGTGDGGYRIYINSSGQVVFGIDNANSFPSDSVTSTSAYDDNKWHHVAAVKNGATSITLYIDALSVGTPDTSIQNDVSNNDSFYIGRYESDTSQDFNGFLDEVKILRSARTADQIKTDFLGETSSRGAGVSFGPDNSWMSQGLVGFWKMDESAANGCPTASADSCDSSGNVKDGAWNGGATNTTGKFGNGVTFDGTGDYVDVGDIEL
jgi:hypothetical protein